MMTIKEIQAELKKRGKSMTMKAIALKIEEAGLSESSSAEELLAVFGGVLEKVGDNAIAKPTTSVANNQQGSEQQMRDSSQMLVEAMAQANLAKVLSVPRRVQAQTYQLLAENQDLIKSEWETVGAEMDNDLFGFTL